MTQKIGVILPLSFGQQPEPPPIGRSAAPLSLYSARRLAGSWLLGFAIDWDIIIYALIPIIVLLASNCFPQCLCCQSLYSLQT